MTEKILIADDDIELCQLLTDFLQLEGFSVNSVHDGQQASVEFKLKDYDLMVLDIMLPGKQGLEVLREIRQQSNLPIVMLTARGDDTDRISVLNSGRMTMSPSPVILKNWQPEFGPYFAARLIQAHNPRLTA